MLEAYRSRALRGTGSLSLTVIKMAQDRLEQPEQSSVAPGADDVTLTPLHDIDFMVQGLRRRGCRTVGWVRVAPQFNYFVSLAHRTSSAAPWDGQRPRHAIAPHRSRTEGLRLFGEGYGKPEAQGRSKPR